MPSPRLKNATHALAATALFGAVPRTACPAAPARKVVKVSQAGLVMKVNLVNSEKMVKKEPAANRAPMAPSDQMDSRVQKVLQALRESQVPKALKAHQEATVEKDLMESRAKKASLVQRDLMVTSAPSV